MSGEEGRRGRFAIASHSKHTYNDGKAATAPATSLGLHDLSGPGTSGNALGGHDRELLVEPLAILLFCTSPLVQTLWNQLLWLFLKAQDTSHPPHPLALMLPTIQLLPQKVSSTLLWHSWLPGLSPQWASQVDCTSPGEVPTKCVVSTFNVDIGRADGLITW